MHEHFQKTRRRRAVGLCLALFMCFATLAPAAQAVGVTGQVSTAQALVPVGHTVGIKLFSRGVLVVKLPEGDTPARESGLEQGDVILKCRDTAVESTEQFQSLLQKSGGESMELQVRRDAALETLAVTPEKNEQGAYTIGAWIRDSMAGIGTVTFYDPASGVFGALGHGITDLDTAQLMPFSSGSILPSTVKAVKRGDVGMAGELRGDFQLDTDLGELYANTNSGIFGTLEENSAPLTAGKALPVARDDEVQVGAATILSNVEGDEVAEYAVEITKVLPQTSDSRNLFLTVTDPELLSKTGGIVQGMSGSPILQNGKIAGAVTHVLLNDPTRGYGILIRHMLADGAA